MVKFKNLFLTLFFSLLAACTNLSEDVEGEEELRYYYLSLAPSAPPMLSSCSTAAACRSASQREEEGERAAETPVEQLR